MIDEHGNEGLDHLEDGIEHVEMSNRIEEQMKCFLCDRRFGSFMEMDKHLSEEHQIDRESHQDFVKWSSKYSTKRVLKKDLFS